VALSGRGGQCCVILAVVRPVSRVLSCCEAGAARSCLKEASDARSCLKEAGAKVKQLVVLKQQRQMGG
jgi:hypothetical protein